MMRVTMPAKPANFDAECRTPGQQWLKAHPDPAEQVPSLWRNFIPTLCAGFNNRCAYLAMWDLNGTVDHYLSVNRHRHRAYDWSNYRYATGWMNSSKQNIDGKVLDPLKVRDEWFELDLASLHLQLTSAVPPRIRPVAEFTLQRLKLDFGRKVIWQRQTYLDLFNSGEMGLDDLEREIPVMATAMRRERVLAFLAANASASLHDIATICETTEDRAKELVRLWRRAGRLQATGKGRAVRYCA